AAVPSASRRSGWRWGGNVGQPPASLNPLQKCDGPSRPSRSSGDVSPRALGQDFRAHGQELPRRKLGRWFWNFRPRLLPDEEVGGGGADGGLLAELAADARECVRGAWDHAAAGPQQFRLARFF